ncbi:MAG: NADH-quinone oxidoreductase subunit NuoH [Bacteroidia bacterium]|nr:NADH-quinone oxidoreductase subunit NuoH [Bacteroidia bacterium]
MDLLPLILRIVICLVFIAVYALVAVYAERKVSAFIQNRLGPMETGPLGLFQTAADILKLLLKEGIIPKDADKILFVAAPIVIFVSVFAGLAAIPFGPDNTGALLNVGLLFIMAIVSVDVIGLLMAGWGSNNKYALLGALRSVSQILSYEIPAGITLLAAVMMYGTLNLHEISLAQGTYSPEPVLFLGIWDVTSIGGVVSWAIFRYPHLIVAYLIYFIASLAECNRAPFDIPEAESELVSGFHLEYSGFRFAIIFLAEYANMFLVGLLAALVFLGGWNTPLPNLGSFALADWTSGEPGTFAGAAWGTLWILLKAFAAVLAHMWIRWTLPRLRVDQLLKMSWKVLTPLAFLLFMISGIVKLLEVYQG